MQISEIRYHLNNRKLDNIFEQLYVDKNLFERQYDRYEKALECYSRHFDNEDVMILSSSGRTEVCGNHTDHQRGCVVAASLNLDAIAVVSKADHTVAVVSEDEVYPRIDADDHSLRTEEYSTSSALIRGVISRLDALGYQTGGFNAYITSDVLIGSGMSSSACFEVLIGTIISWLYNDGDIDPLVLAQCGQYAENVYFNKPCGLMDQVACSVGGMVTIDFKDADHPAVEKINTQFSDFHLSLCIVDTKGSHADLTDEYAAVPREMKEIAAYFDKDVLREVSEEDFYGHLDGLREKYGDRAVLRAIHFFNEQKRVRTLIDALKAQNKPLFESVIKESGDSSYKYLQNVYANSDCTNQSVSLALCISEMLLKGHGVCRVHGGGFSGTIQAFVDDDYVSTYKEEIEKYFGKDSCHVLKIRDISTIKVI